MRAQRRMGVAEGDMRLREARREAHRLGQRREGVAGAVGVDQGMAEKQMRRGEVWRAGDGVARGGLGLIVPSEQDQRVRAVGIGAGEARIEVDDPLVVGQRRLVLAELRARLAQQVEQPRRARKEQGEPLALGHDRPRIAALHQTLERGDLLGCGRGASRRPGRARRRAGPCARHGRGQRRQPLLGRGIAGKIHQHLAVERRRAGPVAGLRELRRLA